MVIVEVAVMVANGLRIAGCAVKPGKFVPKRKQRGFA